MKYLILVYIMIIAATSLNTQWQQTASTPEGAGVTDMVVLNDGTLIVTTASYNWPNGAGGIWRSDDNGNSWQNAVNAFNGRTLFLGSTGRIFASYWPYPSPEGAYVSTNGGSNWSLMFALTGNNNIFSIAAKDNDNTIFLGTRDGIRRSTNGGSTFVNLTNGLLPDSWVRDLAVSSQGLIAAATTKGVFISTNNGDLWQMASGIDPGDTVISVLFDSTGTFDNSGGVLYAGTNNGTLYSALEENDFLIYLSLAIFAPGEVLLGNATGQDLLVILYPRTNTGGGPYQSSNGGMNWIQLNDGLPQNSKTSAFSSRVQSRESGSMDLYVGLFEFVQGGAKIYKRTLPIGVEQISSEIPREFSIKQNYPNPFNPVTIIEFSVRGNSFVKLEIYDMLGREIEKLVNEKLSAGTYRTEWNASNLTSGIYFYKLTSGDFTISKKMILIK